jgi:TolB-like protein
VAHVRPRTREKIIVPNGHYRLEAADTQLRGSNWNVGTRRAINVDTNSNSITIGLTMRYGALVNLSIQNTTGLGGGGPVSPAPVAAPVPVAVAPTPAPAPAARARTNILPQPGARNAATGLEGAVVRATQVLMGSIPEGATLAVLSMASNDAEQSEFVIEEIVFLFVESRRFRIVDRRSLDAVRSEINFQYSGDVDDNSAMAIGRMLGASIVITGSIGGTGNTRRLRAKALNVQTAEILAMASESF